MASFLFNDDVGCFFLPRFPPLLFFYSMQFFMPLVVSSQVLPRVLYSTLPREDELADFQELNLARGNVSKQGGSWLVSEHSKIIEKV